MADTAQYQLASILGEKGVSEDHMLDWIEHIYHVPTDIAQHIMEMYAFARNQSKAIPGNYQTPLNPTLEKMFEEFVKQGNVPFNLKSYTPEYDMRGWWNAMRQHDPRATYSLSPQDYTVNNVPDVRIFFPDTFLTPYSLDFGPKSIYWKQQQ